LLVNRARSFIFSTAPGPAAVAAARAGIHAASSPEGDRRRSSLWRNVESFAQPADGASMAFPTKATSAIVPMHIGSEQHAVEVSAALMQRGFLVPAIRYPTVRRGSARLRVTFTADHTSTQIAALRQNLEAMELA
jgi:8-amino-7-oxononanoate synthase